MSNGKSTTWRSQIAPIVARLVEEARALGLTGRAVLKHVRAGRPYWVRTEGVYSYRVWLHEIESQVRGVSLPISAAARRRARAGPDLQPGQLRLFDQTREPPQPEGGQPSTPAA